jgi:hypothetical protein
MEDEMSAVYNTYGGEHKMYTEFWWGKLKKKKPIRKPGRR